MAQRLEQGPLPLADALHCALDIASHLRELHEDGRVHGEIGSHLVVLRHSRHLLLPPNSPHGDTGSIADVTAFGTLLYEMLTSRKPTTEALLSTPLQPPPRKGPGAVYSAAVRLAERCVTAVPENAPSMQRVLTELRLLSVQTRQWAEAEKSAARPPDAPKPAPSTAPGEKAVALAGDGADDEDSADSQSSPGEEEDLMADGRCPRCRCSKVRVSRPRNRLERLLRAIGLPVRRCHRCYFRYIDLFKACLEMPAKKFNR